MAQIAIAAAISIGVSLASAAISYALTPSTEITGDRLKDLNTPKSNYGEQIPKVFGRARVSGNLVWANKIIERSSKKKSGKGGGKTTTKTYTYYGQFALVFCQGSIVGISRIWVNSKLKYDKSPDSSNESRANSQDWADKYLRIYLGTSTQNVDSLIDASLDDDAFAYRHRAYIVFEDLPLEEYGNQLPQVSVEVVTAGTVSSPVPVDLSTILEYVCLSAGLSSTQIDLSLIEAAEADGEFQVEGYVIDRSKNPKQVLEQLQQAYQFHIVEAEGKLKFYPYERPLAAVISKSQLASSEYGSSRPTENYRQERVADLELPQQVSLSYIDIYRKYQTSIVRAKRVGNPPGENNPQVVLPLSFTSDQAQKVAEKILNLIWLRRKTYQFTLSPQYLYLEAGDVITLPLKSGLQRVQVSKLTIGANFLLQIEAIAYDGNFLIVSEAPEPTAPEPPPITTPGEINLKVLDIPLVQDSDTDNGLYVAADTLGIWRGASLFISRNAGSSWQFATNLELPSTIGVCNNVLGSGSGDTVSVTIRSGELESVDPADLDSGENTALIGSEIIRFESATLTATNTYTLSGLQRGKRGTEWAIGGHGTDELFVLLSDYIMRIDGLASDIGLGLQFKAITGDQDLADVTATTITPVGNSLKPYSVVNPSATKDATGKITITWSRRDRHKGEDTTYTNLPLSEVSESYEIDVLSGSTVLRTLTASSPSVAYSVVDQVTDFGSTQSTISVRLYQISGVVGRGTGKADTLTPTLANALPIITGFAPTQGAIGDTIRIYGSGFTGATSLTINGVATTSLTVVSDTQVTGVVAATTTTGLATITTPGGTANSPTAFVVGAATNFLALPDTPDTYTGQGLKQVRVNADETALEFSANPDFLSLPDTPDTYTGQALRPVRVNAAQNALEFFEVTISNLSIKSSWNFFMPQGANVTIPLNRYATFDYTVNSAYLRTTSGSATVAIQINGTNVTSLSGLTANNSSGLTAATGANSVVVGNRLEAVISSNSSAADLTIEVHYTSAAAIALKSTWNFYQPIGADGTIPLNRYATFNYRIDSVYLRTTSGSATVAIQINGTNVSSLSGLTANSSSGLTSATGANSVVTGDILTAVISANSSALGLTIEVNYTYA
jgi:hypothetical protein